MGIYLVRSQHRAAWVIGVLGFAAIIAWTFWPREKPEVGVSAPLPPAKEVRTIEKIVTKIEYVKVYPDKAKAKLNLPGAVVKDEGKKLTSTGKLRAEERDYTISNVLDLRTGESEVYARPDPLPWIGPGRRGAVGIAYGIRDGEMLGKVYANHDLLQVKALHAGVEGELDQRGSWYTGAYIEYRY